MTTIIVLTVLMFLGVLTLYRCVLDLEEKLRIQMEHVKRQLDILQGTASTIRNMARETLLSQKLTKGNRN